MLALGAGVVVPILPINTMVVFGSRDPLGRGPVTSFLADPWRIFSVR